MNFKNALVAANLGAIALVASLSAQAATPSTHTIQLVADIPDTDFYVVPVDPSWVPNEQRLNWLPLTASLDSWSKDFDVKHTGGSIHAHLDGELAKLRGGSEVIDLAVSFNGKQLTIGAQEVVTKAEALNNFRTAMSIVPTAPTGGYKPGNYTGNIAVIFDAVVVP